MQVGELLNGFIFVMLKFLFEAKLIPALTFE